MKETYNYLIGRKRRFKGASINLIGEKMKFKTTYRDLIDRERRFKEI